MTKPSDLPMVADRAGETPGTYNAWALIVLELDGGRISGWNSFLDTERLFPLFGLPLQTS